MERIMKSLAPPPMAPSLINLYQSDHANRYKADFERDWKARPAKDRQSDRRAGEERSFAKRRLAAEPVGFRESLQKAADASHAQALVEYSRLFGSPGQVGDSRAWYVVRVLVVTT